jgi:hypothetical protein
MNMKRYFIDERGGCIAVRDRNETDPEYQGLHHDTRGVVWYAHGTRENVVCPTCNHSYSGAWVVAQSDRDEAQRVCDAMNAKA